MRALITNDDGVASDGITTLTQAALAAGLDVTVAAPHEERSGASAMLSVLEEGGKLLTERATVAGIPALGVHASPAMIVFVAVRGAFGEPPDIVLSGVNHGPNTGQAVLHSGTVGAALTAVSQGLPALAVSLIGSRPVHFDTARVATDRALGWFLQHLATPYVLNVNVPDIPPGQLRGLRPAGLAAFGAVQAEIGERGEGFVTATFQEIADEPAPGTDVALLQEGWATATALRPPIASDAVDLSGI
ncbi:5'/3'-nucleotidase SurE [Kineosporia sp. NBRC 101731]|uniref:5'/3'-nucleotidase SurE n=1 Tax=Kineosporia sp. NBRC 101731 TaxID=3032199 RepID=UPI0024A24DE8|nr:5'/3'-nucleotidase SurE [Kineosporia sp. NBRC 101731]GLY29971.1 5'/3'-nucleotidase SurE [Kineosporia sp. NBRC 101731]